MSPQLALRFLGSPQVHVDGAPVLIDRRSGVALLAYMAVEDARRSGQRWSRESLSGLLWPDYEQARAYASLRHTLWEINQGIGKGWILANRESVGINAEAEIDLDVSLFRDLTAECRQEPEHSRRIPLLVKAASLYRNHFLTGFSLRGASEFNEWVYSQAEEYRHGMIAVLTMLVDATCASGPAESAVPYARRLVFLDPLNEQAHRRLMQVYLQAGQHSAAMQQYQNCETILRRELGLDPQPETRELYRQIRKGDFRPAPAAQQALPKKTGHNLPFQLTTFVGREKERAQVLDLLAAHRLVTLTGTGGIGKTRLALQVGESLSGSYPEGVWFLPLDALSDPHQVPKSLAMLFDLRELPTRSVIEQLLSVLGPRTLLLILDNCEHLRDAASGLMTTLLAGCPQIKILATSREVLGVEGETVYTVPSLSLPEGWDAAFRAQDKALLDEGEALRLFQERAALVLQTFKVSPENVEAVNAICRCLDGIPLAIELAAARVDILQPQEIFDQLQVSFELLAHRGFAAVPRHQSMRASMDWSWGLLSDAEQVFLRRLSVFAGGWTLEAAQKICDEQALLLLDALAAKSLIVVQRVDGQASRYRLHEIIRQYASEKLSQADEVEPVRERHLQYYLSLAEQAEPALYGRSSWEWLARLHREQGNLRAALAWAEKTNVQAGLNLINWLSPYWRSYGLREAVRWLEGLLDQPETQAYPAERARALSTQSGFLTTLQQFEAARTAARAGLNLARTCSDRRIEIDNLLAMSNLGGAAERREFGQPALHLARMLNDPLREAHALITLAWDRTDFSQARSYYEKAIRLYRDLGDTGDLMVNLVDLGYFEFLYGLYDSAQHRFDEALLLSQELDVSYLRAGALFSRGMISMMNGDLDQARSCLQEAADMIEATGDRMTTLFQHARLGHLAVKQGDFPGARALLGRSAREFLTDRYESGLAYAFEGIASLSVTVGRHAIAARLIGWADAMRMQVNDPRPDAEQADVDRMISACVLKMGEEAFSDAYDAGQAMTMEQAASYALEKIEG